MYPKPKYVLDIPTPSVTQTRRGGIENLVLGKALKDDSCQHLSFIESDTTEYPIFGRLSDGQYMIYDRSLVLERNDLDRPLKGGGWETTVNTDEDVVCSNTHRTFLNERSCVLSDSKRTCAQPGDWYYKGYYYIYQYEAQDRSIICGSPNEIENDPSQILSFDIHKSNEIDTTTLLDLEQQKKSVWVMAALEANDQLRQRMAWYVMFILTESSS